MPNTMPEDCDTCPKEDAQDPRTFACPTGESSRFPTPSIVIEVSHTPSAHPLSLSFARACNEFGKRERGRKGVDTDVRYNLAYSTAIGVDGNIEPLGCRLSSSSPSQHPKRAKKRRKRREERRSKASCSSLVQRKRPRADFEYGSLRRLPQVLLVVVRRTQRR